MALANMHSDLGFNPSSGLAFFHALVWLFFPIRTIYFTSWGVIYEQSNHTPKLS